jgi:glycosyltransferase involved in cell wall biosynthesis
MQNLPLVTCIMPTKDRRVFATRAIAYFLRQDYPNRELLIIDDGMDDIQGIVPDGPSIHYHRLDSEHTVGKKRNLACERAKGEIILHWDDDDWQANWRVSYQVRALQESDADICGLNQIYFYSPATGQAWEYTYPKSAKPWVYGGTLCYLKEFWRRNPFADVDVGEDNHFVWSDVRKRIHPLEDQRFYVGIIHPGNTSPKKMRSKRWQPVDSTFINQIMD